MNVNLSRKPSATRKPLPEDHPEHPRNAARAKRGADAPQVPDASGENVAGEEISVPVDLVDPHPMQLRASMSPDELTSLAASLADVRLLHRITIRPKRGGGRYECLAGGRRLAAAKLAGWKTIPATVRDVDDATAVKIALRENFDRAEVNPIEVAKFIKRACAPFDQGGLGVAERRLESMAGKYKDWASKHTRLLKLPQVWQDRLASGEVPFTSGIELVPYADNPEVMEAIDEDYRRNRADWSNLDNFRRLAAFMARTIEEQQQQPAPAGVRPQASHEAEADRAEARKAAKRPNLKKRGGKVYVDHDTARRLLAPFRGCRSALEVLRAVIEELLATIPSDDETPAAGQPS